MSAYINPVALIVGAVHMAPLLLVLYLGIVRSREVVPDFRSLTIWGLSVVFIVGHIRQMAYWFARGFRTDISEVTQAPEVLLALNVALTIFLLFVADERLRPFKEEARRDD